MVGFLVRVVSGLKGLESVFMLKGGFDRCCSLLPLCHEHREQSTPFLR